MGTFDGLKDDCCFFGRGELFLSDATNGQSWGSNWGLCWGQAGAKQAPARPIGNVSALDINVSFDQRQVLTLGDRAFERDCSICIIESVEFSITMNCFSDSNLKQALFGTVTNVNANPEPVTDHIVLPTCEVPLSCGTFIAFNEPGVDCSSVVVTQTETGQVMIEGQDYECDSCGIVLLRSFLFSTGVGFKLEYSYSDSYRCIEPFTVDPKNVRLQFKGRNAANEGRPYLVTLHNAKLSPASTLSLISDEDFSTLTLTGRLDPDRSITGNGVSQYFNIKRL